MALPKYNDVPGHCTFFYSKMMENRLTGKFTDVNIICCDNRVFKCHRHILAVASPYFDTLFSGNFLESRSTDVKLDKNIDSATFKLILEYIYSGKVKINGNRNMFKVLMAGDILQLDSTEEACVRSFSFGSRPYDDSAIDIIRYICAVGKKSSRSTISQYVIQHLKDRPFPQIPFEEVGILLSLYRPSSYGEERKMLENIFGWVKHNSTPGVKAGESQKALFIRLMQNYPFILSTEFVEDYFTEMTDKRWSNRFYRRHEKDLAIECSKSYIYLCAYGRPRDHGKRRISPKMFTWSKGGVPHNRWDSYSLWVPFNLDGTKKFDMRCTFIDDNMFGLFYSPSELQESSQFVIARSFIHSVSTVKNLPRPPIYLSDFRMCSDESNSIYAFSSNKANSLCRYDCQLNQWSRIKTDDEFYPRAMTWYDHRLYIFGSQSSTSTTNVMRAYDFRAEKFETFPNCNQLYPGTNFECCNLGGQIYLACLRGPDHDLDTEIFDPVAGKRMSFFSFYDHPYTHDYRFRLISFEGLLWAFNCDDSSRMKVIKCYDFYGDYRSYVRLESPFLPGSVCDKYLNFLDAATC